MGAVAPISAGLPLGSEALQLDEPCWYAIHTRSRHEKKVDTALRESGIETFPALTQQVRRWSDRRKIVEVPLFSCYSFVRIRRTSRERLTVLQTSGVLGFVGVQPAMAVPDVEIAQIRRVVEQRVAFSPCPFLKAGQRVRIRGGTLDGMEGIWVGQKRDATLIVSVNLIQRSLAISIEGFDVEPV